MNISNYPEIKPGIKYIKKIYIAVMLFVVGRAIQAAARVDRDIRAECENLPEDFVLCLGVMPGGPNMLIGKNEKGRMKYRGWKKEGNRVTLDMKIKNMEAAFLVFTFQESTAVAFAHDRFIVNGDLISALAIVRVLDLVEVYLLPKVIAKLAVKRYPKWSEVSPFRKYINRVIIYTRTLLGF